MKLLKWTLFSLGYFLFGTLQAQQDSIRIKVFPNPFDSLSTYSIEINEGDRVGFNYFDRLGQLICSIPAETIFKSKTITEIVKLKEGGIYISSIAINDSVFPHKIVYSGTDSIAIIKLQMNVTSSRFKKETLKIFPNPSASETLNIETETESDKVTFTIIDINGKLLHEEVVLVNDKVAKINLNVANWNSGSYVVKMKANLGESKKSFIKIAQ